MLLFQHTSISVIFTAKVKIDSVYALGLINEIAYFVSKLLQIDNIMVWQKLQNHYVKHTKAVKLKHIFKMIGIHSVPNARCASVQI